MELFIEEIGAIETCSSHLYIGATVICLYCYDEYACCVFNTNVTSDSVQYSKPCGVSFVHGTIDSSLVKDYERFLDIYRVT